MQEFRVTTSNYNADQGGTSGAQVAMVTKSGTNVIHGSAYEYHRNTYTSANDFFVKNSELQNCINNGTPLSDPSCNKPPKLIRNIFGGSLGGPIKKDRLYLFMNYEGTRRAEANSQTVAVPSLAMRDGIIQYACSNPSACAGGTVTGLSGATYNVASGNNALSATQITNLDPLHIAPNTAVLDLPQDLPGSKLQQRRRRPELQLLQLQRAHLGHKERVHLSHGLQHHARRQAPCFAHWHAS